VNWLVGLNFNPTTTTTTTQRRLTVDKTDGEAEIPIIKQPEFSKKQTLDTLVNEEALLFAKYLRNEKKDWKPKIPQIQDFGVLR
jgi:hypothetical protein